VEREGLKDKTIPLRRDSVFVYVITEIVYSYNGMQVFFFFFYVSTM